MVAITVVMCVVPSYLVCTAMYTATHVSWDMPSLHSTTARCTTVRKPDTDDQHLLFSKQHSAEVQVLQLAGG